MGGSVGGTPGRAPSTERTDGGGAQRVAHVVAPVDGSRAALTAARHAGHLALLLGARLQLLYAMPAGPAELADIPSNRRREDDADQAGKRLQARDTLASARAELEPAVRDKASNLVIEDVAHHGEPATVIVEYVRDKPDCWVVMGARGLGGLKELFLGSTSDAVLHKAHCPVTVVHDRDHKANEPGPELLLVPVDGSAQSDGAARFAGLLARAGGARVHLLFAYPGHPMEINALNGGMVDMSVLNDQAVESFRAAGRQEARRVFDRARQHLGSLPDDPVECPVEMHDPAEAILEHAGEQTRPVMIVMGRRGMGSWQERLLGSISRTVVARAPCPVTVMHPRE